MYESPGIFWVLWKAVSPFVDPVTRKKVVFVSGHTAVKQLTEEIDPEVIYFFYSQEVIGCLLRKHQIQRFCNSAVLFDYAEGDKRRFVDRVIAQGGICCLSSSFPGV